MSDTSAAKKGRSGGSTRTKASAAPAAAARAPGKVAPAAKAVPAEPVAGPGPEAGRSRAGGSRIRVAKTYKLFVGGAFPRSESGRSYPVRDRNGVLLANVALASRKDVRDAVTAARKAFAGWTGATAYNRGQVLYRVAELMEGRSAQFAAELAVAEGVPAGEADRVVGAAIDRWVWFAGWTDKLAQMTGASNPVAGPYVNFSLPEPTGVVAVLAPPESGLLGLVSVVAPVIATGNTAVVVASEPNPLTAITLSEVLATSDVPGGVVNVVTGRMAELAPVLASHFDVNAIDLTGAAASDRAELERLATGSVKRVYCADEDWAQPPSPHRMLAFIETKTIWHTVGI